MGNEANDYENKKNFMKKMDSGMRTFCGVPQKEEPTEVATEAGAAVKLAAKPKNRKGKWMKKMGKKMKKMMKKKGKGNMFGIFGVMKMAMLFKPFSSADKNGDMKVTPLEMGAFMNKKAKKEEKKAQMKKKWGSWKKGMKDMKKKWNKKKGEMKKKWNDRKNKRKGGRRGDKGRN